MGADLALLEEVVGADLVLLEEVVGADLVLLEEVVGADLALLEEVVGADLALLEEVVGADLVLLEEVVGAAGYIRRCQRVFRQRINLLACLSPLHPQVFGYWLVSETVQRCSRSFPALGKLFNTWRQSFPVCL